MRVLALILAGGKGTRLEPLTRDRAKPAVPFGGIYRIIDFPLSNCLNSGLRQILVLTQYKAASLDRHINLGWRFLCRELDEYVDILPPQQRIDENWYQGTADAVYQNIYSIEKANPEYVLILSGDHIYKMDYAELIRDHVDAKADVTIGCIPVPLAEGDQFGVMKVDTSNRVIEFKEKPAQPDPIPGDPANCLASMGIYVFSANFCSINSVGTPRSSAASTISARTSFRDWSAPTTCGPSRSATKTQVNARIGAMSGLSTPTTRPTWTSSPSSPN